MAFKLVRVKVACVRRSRERVNFDAANADAAGALKTK